jgi:hypothetical protein
MKNIISWRVTPYSRVYIDSSFTEIELLGPSEILVNIYLTAGFHIPENYFLNNRNVNLKLKTDFDSENQVMNTESKESQNFNLILMTR